MRLPQHFSGCYCKMSILGLLTEWGDRIFQSIIVRGKNENLQVLTVDRNNYTARHETNASLV